MNGHMPRTPGSFSVSTGPRIRDAALHLIARHGYAAVSMRQIAAEAGVQAGTIYLYYADKQALLFELMVDIMDMLHGGWRAEPVPEDPMTALRKFVEYHIGFNIDRSEDVFVAYFELRNLTKENYILIEERRSSYEKELQRVLERGMEEGVFNITDVRLTTMAILTTLTGVSTWYREGGRLTRLKVTRVYWRLVRRMVRGGEVPAPV